MFNIAITSYDIGEPPMCKNVGGFPHLSPQEYEKILQYFNEQNIQEFNIIGGEPSIHADLDKIIKATNRFANINPTAKIHLYSNGYNLLPYIKLLGLNIDIVLQWVEDGSKSFSLMDKQIITTFQELYELNYFAQKRAILEIPVGVMETDYSFVLALIKQYNIKTVQIKFNPLYENYDDETSYDKIKNNFFNLCSLLSTKIIINPVDCIPWCRFTPEEKKLLKQYCITYPTTDTQNIIFYGFNKANSHIMDKNYEPYLESSISELTEKLILNNNKQKKYTMCDNCRKKKCFGRWGRTT